MDALAKRLSRGGFAFWPQDVAELRRRIAAEQKPLPRIKDILARAVAHASSGQRGQAANWFVFGLLVDQAESFQAAKKVGLLRASKYSFDPAMPRFIAQTVLAQSQALGLEPRHPEYLESVLALLITATEASAEAKRLLDRLRAERYLAIRSCLITIDAIFMQDTYPDLRFGLNWTLDPWSKEELAEGFSYLWFLASTQLGHMRWTAGGWNVDGIVRGTYLDVLRRAAALREFAEAEILVDAFDYSATASEAGVVISPPYPELEHSIRLGFIDHEMQEAVRIAAVGELNVVRIRQAGERFHAAARDRGLIEQVDRPVARVRFQIPNLPVITDMIRGNRFYAEEVIAVGRASKAYGLEPDALLSYTVGQNLTLRDISRAQRLASFVSSYVATELATRSDDPTVVVSSLSSVYPTRERLTELLGVAMDVNAVQEFVDMFSWPPPNNSRATFDLQYRPLLNVEGEWHVPMHVLARSALMRAALMLTGRRPAHLRNMIEQPIIEAFREQGCQVETNIKIDIGRRRCEIDVAAIVGGSLLILECKASILPVNTFELRTSYDACVTAASQLDRALELLQSADIFTALMQRLNYQGPPPGRVLTGIVTENRLFSGIRFGRHTAIALGHLLNVIAGGTISIGLHEAPIRTRDTLHESLVEFLDGAFYARMFAGMVRHSRHIAVGRTSLIFDTSLLDLRRVASQFGIVLAEEEVPPTDGASQGVD